MAGNDDDRVRARRDDDANYRDERARQRDEYDYEGAEDRPARRIQYEGDATGGLIPYKNALALASYYCGVFGLISCVILLGFFGIVPIILGFLGLKYAKKHPEARGQVHAIIGIVLGMIEVLTFLAQLGFIIVRITAKK